MKPFENRFVSIWIEDGILMSDYKPGTVMDFDAAKTIVEDRLQYTKGKSFPILIDFTHIKSVTKEARDYMNNSEGGLKGLLCGAFVGNNSVAVLFINLYLKINRPVIPTRFFTSKKDALRWLTEIRNELNV
jgi:hypothetical protein